MDIESRMNQITMSLKSLKNYGDIEGFIKDLEYQIGQLNYFYDKLTPSQTGDPSTTIYTPKKIPRTHQLAYFNLTRGFPKELYGGHWCYIFKYFKSKFVIIPTTSVKPTSLPANPEFQIDIQVKGFKNGYLTRLQIGDIRTVDIQRLYYSKGFYDVLTDREEVLMGINKILLEA